MTTVFTATLTSSDNGYAGYTVVQVFPASALDPATGSQVRLTLKFSALVSGCIVSVYMAKQAGSGDAYDFANTPAHVTFSGGDITGDGTTNDYVSDWVNLPEAYDEAVNYVVAAQFNGGGGINVGFPFVGSITGANSYYKLALEAATVNKTGYTANYTNTVELFSKIEIQAVAGNVTLNAAAGSYGLSGSNAALAGQAHADPGSYAYSGVTAKVAFGQTAAAGSYALTGTAAGLVVSNNVTLTAAGGSYALSGSAAAFVIPGSLVFPAASGSYALTGSPAAFLGVTPPPPTDNYTGGGVRRIRKFRKRKREDEEEVLEDIGAPVVPPVLPPVPAPPALPSQPGLMAGIPIPPRTVLRSPPDDDDEEAVALLLELLS
jgi:hypothetical protein